MSAEQFLKELNEKASQLYPEDALSGWYTFTTGDKEWAEKFEKALAEVEAFHGNTATFEKITGYLTDNQLTSEQRRQLEVMHRMMEGSQFPKELSDEITKRSSELKQKFNTFKPSIEGEETSTYDLQHILTTSKESARRKKAWEASKNVGKEIAQDLIELVKVRNKAAQSLGFNNYFELEFSKQELDIDEIFSLFDHLTASTEDSFRELKQDIDTQVAEEFNIDPAEIRPWHYTDLFFQSVPSAKETELEDYYKKQEIIPLAIETYKSLGMDLEAIMEKSDLEPHDKKMPGALCVDINRKGDIRILSNVSGSERWMEAMLHEMGHAAYFNYIDQRLPFILRNFAHIATTESIAKMMEKKNKTPEWLRRFLNLSDQQIKALHPHLVKQHKLQTMLSIRSTIAFVTFERELYVNPEQDLNKKWWEIMKKYQLINPPDNTDRPDWASKIHYTLVPVYSQNYLIGQLIAAQLEHYIHANISGEFFTPETGAFLKDEFFSLGASRPWSKKVEEATGEPLNSKYLIRQCEAN